MRLLDTIRYSKASNRLFEATNLCFSYICAYYNLYIHLYIYICIFCIYICIYFVLYTGINNIVEIQIEVPAIIRAKEIFKSLNKDEVFRFTVSLY